MSLGIRIALLIAAIGLFVYVMYSIRKTKMRIEDTLFWAFLSLLILLMSISPDLAAVPSRWLGFQAPVNFVFLLFIGLLLLKCFLNSRQISRLETKVKELSQHIAVDRLDHHDRRNDQ